jgi:chromosome segregation ATPase
LVAGLLFSLAAVSGADIIRKTVTGTGVVGATPSPSVARPAKPASPALPVEPGGAVGDDPTAGLQRELGQLDRGLSADDRRDLRQDIKDEADDVELEIDEVDADLEEQADILSDIDHDDGVEGSKELQAAEDKLASLEDELAGLDARFRDIRLRADRAVDDDGASGDELNALLADIRSLGAGIDAMDAKIDELDVLVSAADDKSRERDDHRDHGFD